MVRLGIVDFDSSHAVAFTQILNHTHPVREQWVDGARVVVGCVLPSKVQAEERIRAYAAQCAAYGVEMVNSPEELIGRVDGVLLESDDGRTHLERARPFLEAGIPTFIDKPLPFSLEEGREILHLAKTNAAPLFSASALRFAQEVVAVRQEAGNYGALLGASTYSPANDQGENPGLIYYGIHAIEMLYGLMGVGCKWVSSAYSPQGTVITAEWSDGRVSSLRGTTQGAHAYGFTAWCAKAVVHTPVNPGFIYRELMKRVVEFFRTGIAPVAPEETLETIAFGQAAVASLRAQGKRIELEQLM